MTANQVAYWNMQETRRANRVKERETERSNRVREEETHRTNVAQETERNRAATVQEAETRRHNLETEDYNRDKLPADYMSATGSLLRGAGSFVSALPTGGAANAATRVIGFAM